MYRNLQQKTPKTLSAAKNFCETAGISAVFFLPIAQHTEYGVTVTELLTLRPASGIVKSGTSAFSPFAFSCLLTLQKWQKNY